MKTEKKTMPVQFRTFGIERSEDAEKTRTVSLSFSSEEPYQRYDGIEILDHAPESIDLSRLNDGAGLFVNHDPDQQVGVVVSAKVDGKVGRATVRFGKSARAEEIFRDVLDGIRSKISVAYRTFKRATEKIENDVETYRVTRWLPLEVSIVGIPADNTVGIGRNDELNQSNEMEVSKQDEPEKPEEEATSNAEAALSAGAAEKSDGNGKPATDTAPHNIQVKRKTPMSENKDQDPVAVERARVAAIMAIGSKFDCANDAANFVADGRSEHDFRCWLLENKFKAVPAPSPEIGMSDKEVRQYSIVEGIRQMVEDKKISGLIKEASDATAKLRGKPSRGFYVPHDVQSRDATIGTTTTGGYTGAAALRGPMIEALDNAMVAVKAGATVLSGLTGNTAIYIPRTSSHATSYWVAEAGAVTEGQWTLAQVALTPKTVGAYTEITRQLLNQSAFPVEQLIRNDLTKSIALAVDLAALYGNYKGTTTLGTQPIGLLNNTTITRTAFGSTHLGAVPTYAEMIGMQTTVGGNNGFGSKMAYMTNHSIRGLLKVTPSSTAVLGAGFICNTIDRQDYIDGFPLHVTNQIPSTIALPSTTLGAVGAGLLFGDFEQLLIGFWTGTDIVVDPYNKADYGITRVIAFQDVDVTVRQPNAFVRVTDAKSATT